MDFSLEQPFHQLDRYAKFVMLKIVFQGKIEDQITLIHTIVNNREFRMNKFGHNLLCQILSQNAEKIVRNPIGNAVIQKVLEDGDKYSENFRDIRIILEFVLAYEYQISIA